MPQKKDSQTGEISSKLSATIPWKIHGFFMLFHGTQSDVGTYPAILLNCELDEGKLNRNRIDPNMHPTTLVYYRMDYSDREVNLY